MRDLTNFIYSFVFDPPLSGEEVASFRHDVEPWPSLAYLVHLASEGDFSQVGRVEWLLRSSDHALFWSVATKFVGMAGGWDTIEAIATAFGAESNHAQSCMANMLMFSCNPAFSDRLIELYEAAEDNEIRQGIAWKMSFLLEPAPGLVWIGARESDKYGGDDDDDESGVDFANMSIEELFSKKRDYGAYREAISSARKQIVASGVREGEAVLEGSLLNAKQLAMRVADRAMSPSDTRDRMLEEMVLLSAMTGTDFASLLKRPGGIDRLETCALIEGLLEGSTLDRMIPGQRYFLGHAVPARAGDSAFQ